MPKAPSPLRAEAKSMYLASGGKKLLRIIAEELELSEGTVRGWKAKDCWDDELNGTLRKKGAERSNKKKRNAPKKRGAPKGNKNAAGHKGVTPTGEGNGNYKHGAYTEVYWDVLDDDERIFAESEMADEESMLEEQIRLLTIRERRIMKAIQTYRDKLTGQSVSSIMRYETKKEFRKGEEEEKERYDLLRRDKQDKAMVSYYGHDVNATTMTTANIDIIKSLEATLTQVQARKTMCIKALAGLRMQREKLELVKLKMGIGDDDQLKRAIELLGGIESAF